MRAPLSSSDNPQFESQPLVNGDPPPVGTEPQLPAPASTDPFAPQSLAPAAIPVVVAPLPRDPVWSGWDVLLIALLTLVTLIVVELLTVVGARVFVFRHTSLGDLAQKPVLALLGEFFSYIAVAMYMVMLVEGKYHARFWQAIRWNWPSSGAKVAGLGALGAFTITLDALGNHYLPLPKSTPFDQFFAHPSDAYLMAFFAVTFGPLMEELFFRGFLYPVLVRRIGVLLAVPLTAVPFGLIHYLQYKSWAAVLVITMVGVVLTVVREVTKSVASSFLVHAGYNATLMVLAAVATDGFRHMDKAVMIPFPLR